MSFTPGPWEIGDLDRNDQRQVIADGRLICVGAHECLASQEASMEANARLIAAAPDLYVALKAVLALYGPSSEYGYEARIVWQQAERAILKADGRDG